MTAGHAAARRVLFVTSNGGGLGHLTRAMAVARRLPEQVEPVVVTQSQAVAVVRRQGLPVEYIASRGHLRVPLRDWQRYAFERMVDVQDHYRPAVLVFDGAVPPDGLLRAFAVSGASRIWLRRATWRAEADPAWAALSSRFDLVVEPGDIAGGSDHGPTVAERDRALVCDPITFFDREELLAAGDARDELALDRGRPAALVTLGAGNIDDITSPVGRIARALDARGVQVVVTRSPIAQGPLEVPAWVRVVERYPIGRHLRAFDLAVAASGYNVVHELTAAGVPAVYLPNRNTGLDDQVTRARAAERAGVALVIEEPSTAAIEHALRVLDHASVPRRMRRRAAALARPNGAERTAAVITQVAGAAGEEVPGG